MVIVEDQQERPGAGQLVEQGRKQALRGGGLRGLQELRKERADGLGRFADRFDQVAQEQGRIVLGFLERKPGRRAAGAPRPLRQ
jgi:hypothetical protein